MKNLLYFDSPIGLLRIAIEERSVVSISLADCRDGDEHPTDEFALLVSSGLERYFAGKTKELAFPVRIYGTQFQMRVWEELRRIPYGSVATYGEIARRIGSPGASRAVGLACNRNRLLLAVPCHRVVGAGGKLTGFAVGTERKEFLLRLERSVSKQEHGVDTVTADLD